MLCLPDVPDSIPLLTHELQAIRRVGDYGIHTARRQQPELLKRVAAEEAHSHPLSSTWPPWT